MSFLDLGEMKVFYPDVNILNQENSPAKFGFTSITNTKNISEAYHKAKADGSNPELVKAVEELIGKPKEETPNVEDWSIDVESTAKALGDKTEGLLPKPTDEVRIEDLKNKNFSTFTYNKESDIPDIFKDKIIGIS